MAKQISRQDISEQDLFKNVRDSAIQTLKIIDELNKEFKETATTLKNDIAGAKFGNAAEIDKFVKAVTKANKLKKESIELDKLKKKTTDAKTTSEKELAKQKAEELKNERNLLKETRLLNAEKEKAKKTSEKQAKALADENNEYKKLVKATRDQKNESKKLAAELLKLEASGGKNTKEWRKLSAQYRKTTKAAQKGDKALKKIDATVGDNFRNVGNYKSALGGLTRVLSGLGLAFGGLSVVKGAGQTIVDFDKNIQDLRAITGASGSDLEFFKEQAKTLGLEVEGGASSVIEAYKLIGSAKPELLGNAQALSEVTESAILLSQASGLDLPEASKRLTDAMNQFGAPAEQAGEFINILANGALFGSAAIPDVTDALLKFGAAAKSSNVSMEESTALIESLASKGLKGAEAGTALRNIMLKLSAPDALPKEAQERMAALGISFDTLKDTSKPFAERLDELKPLLSDSAALQKVFGKENAIAATNLLNMTGEVKELTENMKTQGTVQEQAAKNTDTVAFAFNKLKETWNKFILDLDQGAGIGEKIKGFLNFLSDNLETIVSVLGTAIKAFVTYKAIITITALQNKVLASSFFEVAKSQKGVKGAFASMTKGIKNVGKALKANALGAALAALFWSFQKIKGMLDEVNASSAKYAEIQEEITDINEGATEQIGQEKAELELLVAEIKLHNAGSEERGRLLQEMNDKYGTHLQNIEDETQANKDLEVAMLGVIEAMETRIRLNARKEEFTKVVTELQKAEDDFSKSIEANTKKINKQTDKQINAWIKRITAGKNVSAEYRKQLNALSIQEKRNFLINENLSSKDLGKKRLVEKLTRDKLQIEKELGLQMEENDQKGDKKPPPPPPPSSGTSEKTISLIRQIEDAQIKQIEDDQERKEAARIKDFERLVEDTREKKTIQSEFDQWLIEQTRLKEKDLQKIADDAEAKKRAARNRAAQELTQAAILEKEIELEKLGDTALVEQQRAELQDQLDELRIAQLKQNAEIELQNTELSQSERQRIIKESELAIEKIIIDGNERRAELRKKQFNREIKAYEDAEKEKHLTLLKSDKTQKEIDAEMFEFQKEQLQARIDWLKENYPEMTDLIRDEEIKLAQMQRRENDELLKDDENAAADKIQRAAEVADAITNYFIKKSDERIAKIDEEIAAAQKQASFLEQLAADGNIKAEQSLAEQNRIIAEANRKKELEEQRKQRLELVNAALQTYAAKASDPNVENPLLETIRDIALLQQFIATIPAFLDGTEDTGTNGRGIDGKGGFNAILHPNERVMTKEQNAKVGNLSNNDLAKVAQEYNAGKLISSDNATQIGGAWESVAVLKELQTIQDTIKNKPETNIRLEEIINGALMITRETRKGNSVIYDRYKTKS